MILNTDFIDHMDKLRLYKKGDDVSQASEEAKAFLLKNGYVEGEAQDTAGSENTGKVATVKELAAKIKEAATAEDVQSLSAGDERQGVKDAVAKRLSELDAAGGE